MSAQFASALDPFGREAYEQALGIPSGSMLDALPYADWSEAQQLDALAYQSNQADFAAFEASNVPSDAELEQVWQDNVHGAFLAAPEPMTDTPSTDGIPSQNYTQEALLKAAESGDYAKVVDLVTQNTSPVDRLISGSRLMGEARALPGPGIWYDMLDTKYLGSYMRGSISFADTVISGGKELWNLGGDMWNYAQGTHRSALTGEFMPASQLGMSIQTKGWGQTGLDLFSGIVHAPFEAAAGLYHNDPERVGAGLTFWAPALGITSRFSRGSAPGSKSFNFSGGKPTLADDAFSPGVVNQRSAEFYKLYGDNPSRGTLSNIEARQWYLAEDAQILNRIDSSASLEMQARQAFDLRNANRTEARILMSDRVSADRLFREEPNLTWDQIVTSKKNRGLLGDDIYRSILQSSQKTRASINEAYGLD